MLAGQGLPACRQAGRQGRFEMSSFSKYLSSYLHYKLSRLLAGRKNYEEWFSKNYSLQQVELKNKKLAEEIEVACKKKGGSLTYAEFLNLDQFGANGYHAREKDHGMTYTHRHWGKAVAILCKKEGIPHVLEFGPGVGNLAIEILKESQKINFEIKWSGIELNQELRDKIKSRFHLAGFKSRLIELVSDIDKLKTRRKSIVVFSYSLDSIPPQIFINTEKQRTYTNAVLGVTLHQGVLREVSLEASELERKGIVFENGIYAEAKGPKFDLSSWVLYPGQRAYIPIQAFSTLADFAHKFSNSIFIIIDEIRPLLYPFETGHLGIPKDLNRYRRDLADLEKAYRETGENLLYYPIYFLTLYKFLHSLGFRFIQYDIEQRMAKEISGDSWRSLKGLFSTYSFLAKDKKEPATNLFPLEFPKTKFF